MKRLIPTLSLKGKTITAMVLVGLLPLILSLLLTYFEERRALRETTGINFKGIAVEVARKVETQITRGINEAQQLAEKICVVPIAPQRCTRLRRP